MQATKTFEDILDFNFYSDAGHGWLEVDKGLLDVLGIADKITKWSYKNGRKVYLEQDCDAGTLFDALRKRKIMYRVEYIYEKDDSHIKRYARYDGSYWNGYVGSVG